MARTKKATEFVEQKIPIPASMNTDLNNYVVMRNELILGAGRTKGKDISGITITAQKLLRLLIMQCLKEDMNFRPYKITTSELASFLGIDRSNLSREKVVQDLTISLLSEVVLIGDGNPNHKWKAFQWVSEAEYDGNGTYTFRLHDGMKEYLLNLGRHYTQYEIGEIMSFRSVYALRIFELITMTLGIQHKKKLLYNNNEVVIDLPVETIRIATGTTKRYLKANDFKKNVIDIAKKEINARSFGWRMDYTYIKEGKKVIGYHIILRDSLYGIEAEPKKWQDEEMKRRDRETGQINMYDLYDL